MVPSGGIAALNELPPENTLRRCEEALELWRSERYDYLLVSGGIFLPPHIQTRAAADIMRDWFAQQGVSTRMIIVERESVDTFENVRLSAHLLTKMHVIRPRITVVTQWQHALRFWVTFRLGYGLNVAIRPIWHSLAWYEHVTEFGSLAYHVVDPRGNRLFARKCRRKRLLAAGIHFHPP